MVFRHGSQGIHFHPFLSVAPSGRISMELSQAEGLGYSVRPLRGSLKSTCVLRSGLQAWVRKERKFALQGQRNVFLSPPPEIVLSGYVRVAPFQGAHSDFWHWLKY
jgi:hypothetical protein